jgi:hypothetical protein
MDLVKAIYYALHSGDLSVYGLSSCIKRLKILEKYNYFETRICQIRQKGIDGKLNAGTDSQSKYPSYQIRSCPTEDVEALLALQKGVYQFSSL